MDKILLFMGMMKRANAIAIGADATYDACRKRQSKLLVLSSDAGKHAKGGANNAANGVCAIITIPYTKSQIGELFGRAECATFAITDSGFAAALKEKLSQAEPHKGGNTQ